MVTTHAPTSSLVLLQALNVLEQYAGFSGKGGTRGSLGGVAGFNLQRGKQTYALTRTHR